MADSGYLVPPAQDASKEEMWLETRKRLDRFLPNLFTEVFPDTAMEAEKPLPTPAKSSPANTSGEAGVNEDVCPSNDTAGAREADLAESQPISQGNSS